jgi:hypothetical protein
VLAIYVTNQQPRMIERATRTPDLIGYLSFDVLSHQATLVVCGPAGRPLREIPLIAVGSFMRFVIRLAIRFGRYRRSCRAVARDDCDSRVFVVWMSSPRRVVVSDENGEHWLRSAPENVAAAHRESIVVPNPDVIKLVRRLGFGDASRN